VLLGIAAIACGLAVQVFGVLLDKVLASEPVIAMLSVFVGFGVMGFLIYKWAIK
jgi:F0F1-type ATP synthase assembly protein I